MVGAVALLALRGDEKGSRETPSGGESLAFFAPAKSIGRREAARDVAAIWASAGLLPGATPALAEVEPLPPPVLKDVVRAAPKIQEGADWLVFELKAALKAKDLEKSRRCTGSAMQGSYVSPLESNLIYPFQQLISANDNAEEDGWLDASRTISNSIDSIKNHIGGAEWDEAMSDWEKVKTAANVIMANINERADTPYFTLIDGNYDSRADLYLQKKKDDLAFRNAAGSLAMR